MNTIKISFFALIICTIISCSSNDNKEQVVTKEVTDTVNAPVSGDTNRTIVNRSMIWKVTLDSADKEKLRAPQQEASLDTFTSSHLVELLNQNFPDIKLYLKKISHDTIYVKIPDSKRLTNELGNTGAQNYLAAATFTLTELKNVRFVNIDMEPGDHAEPGVYSRDDFKNLR